MVIFFGRYETVCSFQCIKRSIYTAISKSENCLMQRAINTVNNKT